MSRVATVVGSVLVAVLAVACDAQTSTAEQAAGRAECKKLMAHIFQITPRPGADRPETDPARLQALVAGVPVEDLDQCATADPKVIACLRAAGDAAALRACLPKAQ